MPMLPIVGRELRVAARRRPTYWLRLAAPLAAILVTAWTCLGPNHPRLELALGKALFSTLSILAFGYCLLIGPFITADCLSEEKREGTLGLLFLTSLKSYDVVLGKWFATSLAAFYGLLAILPWLGIPLLLGGVTPGEYGRVTLAVVNAIFFSLAAGMFVSVLSREQGKATLGALILILSLSGLLPGLMALFVKGFLGRGAGGFPPVALASPAYGGQLAMDAIYRANPKLFWTSAAIVHGLGWLFLVATMVLVPRQWRQGPDDARSKSRWILRLGRTRRWQRRLRRRLEKYPVYAAASRHRWPHWVFWCLVSLVAVNVYWLTFGYRRNPQSAQFHQQFSYALYFINRVWITTMACRFFLEARWTGALELLLTTPQTVREILRGHRRALARLFFWPVLVIAALHCCYLLANWPPPVKLPGPAAAPGLMHRAMEFFGLWDKTPLSSGPAMSWNFQFHLVTAIGSMTSFLADVVALSCVGAWLSLASKRAALAILKTFVLVILIPWTLGYFFTVSNLLMNWIVPAGPVVNKKLLLYYSLRPAFYVTKDLIFIAWAAIQIRRHFRAAAARTYGLKEPRRRWWRFLVTEPGPGRTPVTAGQD